MRLVRRLIRRLMGETPPFLRLSSRANLLFRILVYCAVIPISLFYITTKTFSKYITNITIIFKISILYCGVYFNMWKYYSDHCISMVWEGFSCIDRSRVELM
jgi:hypothetical protein